MKLKSISTVALLSAAIAQTASAAIINFSSISVWTGFVAGQGYSVATEDFNSYNGFYNNGLSGSAGGVTWTASAPGDLYADLGYMSTSGANSTLTFNLSPNVQGVGGNFFVTDINFNILPGVFRVDLADGSAFIGFTATTTDFVGFYSTGAAISSISVSVSDPVEYATVDNLYFTVPGPGAIALLGLAGLVSRRRR